MFDPHIGPQTSRLQIIRNHAEWFPYILRWHVRGKLIWFLTLVTMLSKDSSWHIQTYILVLIKQLLLIQESLQKKTAFTKAFSNEQFFFQIIYDLKMVQISKCAHEKFRLSTLFS